MAESGLYRKRMREGEREEEKIDIDLMMSSSYILYIDKWEETTRETEIGLHRQSTPKQKYNV